MTDEEATTRLTVDYIWTDGMRVPCCLELAKPVYRLRLSLHSRLALQLHPVPNCQESLQTDSDWTHHKTHWIKIHNTI